MDTIKLFSLDNCALPVELDKLPGHWTNSIPYIRSKLDKLCVGYTYRHKGSEVASEILAPQVSRADYSDDMLRAMRDAALGALDIKLNLTRFSNPLRENVARIRYTPQSNMWMVVFADNSVRFMDADNLTTYLRIQIRI